ncbi:MAG: hypothetical protein JWO36_1493 [Myxococcales bacterium]|nr:hypothetical protein [Myxococcales bacterium]
MRALFKVHRVPRPRAFVPVLLLVGLLSGTASAETSQDGYCDYVEGVASATSAALVAPQLFGQFGYVEQPPFAINPSTNSGLRLIAGVRFSFTGVYQGVTTKDHAKADCARHQSLESIRGETQARALSARAKIIDAALLEADKILGQSDADMQARRTTAQEATATRLRVEELRELSAETHRQLAALPAETDRPLGAALVAYHKADADMEDAEAKLRKSQLFDVNLRFGLDEFLDNTVQNNTPYFAVLSVGVSLGALWQGGANDRAAAGRKRLVKSGADPIGGEATIENIRSTVEVESKRKEQTEALVAELDRQLDALGKVGGDDSKRYRQTVWFEAVKAKAELAYLKAHLRSLKEVIGGSEESARADKAAGEPTDDK